MWRQVGGLLGWLVLVAAVATASAQFSPGSWYAALRKPPGTPPPWVFGPVWTLLYTLMAVAAWMVWSAEGPPRLVPLGLFILQLVANGAWSWLFFGLRMPLPALADILLLLVLLAACVLSFRAVRPAAALLLLPYLAWVCYAAYLNAGIWILNRS